MLFYHCSDGSRRKTTGRTFLIERREWPKVYRLINIQTSLSIVVGLSNKEGRPISVYVETSSKSSSESNPTISVDTTVSIQLSELRNQFEELERGLEDGSQEKQAAKDLAKDVDSIREYTSKEELKKSPVMRKLKDFLKGIGKAGELANSIATKVDGGMDKVRKIAETYNKLARICGFDPIDILLG